MLTIFSLVLLKLTVQFWSTETMCDFVILLYLSKCTVFFPNWIRSPEIKPLLFKVKESFCATDFQSFGNSSHITYQSYQLLNVLKCPSSNLRVLGRSPAFSCTAWWVTGKLFSYNTGSSVYGFLYFIKSLVAALF